MAPTDRLVVLPLEGRWTNEVDQPDHLSRETIEELGWKGPKAATRLIASAAARASKKAA